MLLGTDEAGRGPLVGSMVMATIAIEDVSQLPAGLKDSKQLSPKQREQFYEKLVSLPHAIRVCPPVEVDAWVHQGKLNWLEAEKTVEMINELLSNTENAVLPTIVIDCPARNLETYKAWIAERISPCSLIVQYKADVEHPVVAAASIIAKVTRDRLIEEIKKETGIDFGSGYLTDPKTQLLFENFDPDFMHFRKSWQPYKDALAKKFQKTLF